ncbi:MAG: MBL fold metallo-hydrolase [Defluviitaleaceae bacterium]|nr:MBL fold metallo-hydrolase [Defluviitaleaceae bacterium]
MTVESRDKIIVIDAGSGLLPLGKELKASPVNILISHLHLDHIIGLGVYGPVWGKDSNVKIFTCSRDERSLKEQIFGAFVPPYWPSSLVAASGAECIAVNSGNSFNIDHFTITPFLAEHPDKTLSFHITDGDKNFVHLLDSEIEKMSKIAYEELMAFCNGADLVVFDSAYAKEDYHKLKGWGHSTVEQGVLFARECKPKRMVFSHFGQDYSDEQIDSWASFFENETYCEFILGSEGMEIVI